MTIRKLTIYPSDEDIQSIYDAIQYRAKVSLVDHRFILATILQEVSPPNQIKSKKEPN